MVTFTVGRVVLIPFPFSDLSLKPEVLKEIVLKIQDLIGKGI